MHLLQFREWAMLALVFFGWVGGQYLLSMLVLTGNVAGLVLNMFTQSGWVFLLYVTAGLSVLSLHL